jgi:hypothetical protein
MFTFSTISTGQIFFITFARIPHLVFQNRIMILPLPGILRHFLFPFYPILPGCHKTCNLVAIVPAAVNQIIKIGP